jgi:hypothetical protein
MSIIWFSLHKYHHLMPESATIEPEILRRNQRLLLAFFLFSLFNGALRKWIFTGNSGVNSVLMVIQLAFPVFVIFLMKREKSLVTYTPLVPFLFVLICMALNPINQSIGHGVFGVLIHIGFWFTMLAYLHERDRFPFEDLLQPFILLTFGEILLTFVQFGLPTTHILNRYESDNEVTGFEGGLVRVIGTFSYIGGYGGFIFFVGLLIWALMIDNKRSLFVIYGLALLGLLSSFMNGSRAIVLPFVLCVFFGFVGFGGASNKIKAAFLLLFIIFLGAVYNVNQRFPSIGKAYDAFAYRVTSSGDNGKRTMETFNETTGFRGSAPLLGLGLGATYQGAIATWGKSDALKEYGYYEEEPERILLEGGYFLLILRAFLFLFFMFKSKIPIVFSAPLLFYTFFFTQMTFSTFQSTFIFFGFAILDKMYYLKNVATDYTD